ncbi:MAG: hypothetical protein U9O55_02185 [Patescibacteria group bacterium]|nr:hypothetical protein [Patescibacteria group bacterium]
MRFNKKLILKIIAVVVIVSIIISIFLWFYYKKISSGDNSQKIIDNIVNSNNNSGDGFPDSNNINNNINSQPDIINNNDQIPAPEAELKSIVVFTAERIGSYSTDTQQFANLNDINCLMTDKMKKWVDDLHNEQKNGADKEYYGVTTKVLSVQIIDVATLENGIADVAVVCQRIEIKNKDNPVSKIKYQNLNMRLIKVNEKWLIDSIEWE